MYTNIKTLNGKELQFKTLVNSRCTYMDINEQLVKEERIKTAPLPRLFDIFNADRTRSGNHKVTWFVLLKL